MPSPTGGRAKATNVRLTEREIDRLNRALPYLQVSQAEFIRQAIQEKLDRDLEREMRERELLALRARQPEEFAVMGRSRQVQVMRQALANARRMFPDLSVREIE
jgi:hypothetical protein